VDYLPNVFAPGGKGFTFIARPSLTKSEAEQNWSCHPLSTRSATSEAILRFVVGVVLLGGVPEGSRKLSPTSSHSKQQVYKKKQRNHGSLGKWYVQRLWAPLLGCG